MTIRSSHQEHKSWETVAAEWLLECEKLKTKLRRIKEVVDSESSTRLRTDAEEKIITLCQEDR